MTPLIKTPKFVHSLFPSVCWKIKTTEKELYLTFDDSPTPKFTYWILNLLDDLDIKATFFCIGKKSENNSLIISKIISAGHNIGNHSYSHKNGLFCTTNDYCKDIEKCEKILPETILFRPPYGKIYPWQINQIKKKYRIILWDVISYDFKKNITKEQLKANVLDNIDNGSIIVFHDNMKSEKNLKESLREILIEIKNQGFRFKLFRSNTKEV